MWAWLQAFSLGLLHVCHSDPSPLKGTVASWVWAFGASQRHLLSSLSPLTFLSSPWPVSPGGQGAAIFPLYDSSPTLSEQS